MHHKLLLGVMVFLLLMGSGCAAEIRPLMKLHTQDATFEVNESGALCAIHQNSNARNYLATGQPAPLLSIQIDGKLYGPDSATAQGKKLTLHYAACNATVVLAVQTKSSHVVFEVVKVTPEDRVELVLWGPYPTTIGDIVGDTVELVRCGIAIGIQAANARTLGGYPSKDSDTGTAISAGLDHGHYPNLPAELNKEQKFRGDTARWTKFGSVLQAYCRQRNHERIIKNWATKNTWHPHCTMAV